MFDPLEGHKEDAPVVIFLDGGPGCSTTYSLFDFIGPYYVDNYKYNPTTHSWEGKKEADLRKNSWSHKAYLLIIDQPVGMGFSQVYDYQDVAKSAEQVRNDFNVFINKFYEKHSELQGKDLYITGHSYAGHYIPYTVSKMLEDGFDKAPIKGISIGNPYMNGKILFQSYPTFAAKNHRYTQVTQAEADSVKPLTDLCGHLFDQPRNHLFSYRTLQTCQKSSVELTKYLPKGFDINYMPSDWKYNSSYVNFLNDDEVQDNLNFDKSQQQHLDYHACNSTFRDEFFNWDWKVDSRPYFLEILERENIRVLMYAGDLDFRCNYQQTETLLDTMKWTGSKEWEKAKFSDCKYGICKSAKNLKYIRFSGAGHTVPLYKEEKAMNMLDDFLENNLNF